MIKVESALAQTQGSRDYQEDTAAIWPGGNNPFVDVPMSGVAMSGAKAGGLKFAVLADGMGGHAGGSLASRLVCDHFLSAATSLEGGPAARLAAGLAAANDAIARKVFVAPAFAGMGSTLIGAAFSHLGLEWVSVGDSPMFLYRRGDIVVLNEDHSLAPELDRQVAAGRLTGEQARRDPRRHMLRSAVTGDEIDLIDVSRAPLALEPHDVVILASDGIATIDTTEISRIVAARANEGAAPTARALIRAVEDVRMSHQDNTTVVVVRVLG